MYVIWFSNIPITCVRYVVSRDRGLSSAKYVSDPPGSRVRSNPHGNSFSPPISAFLTRQNFTHMVNDISLGPIVRYISTARRTCICCPAWWITTHVTSLYSTENNRSHSPLHKPPDTHIFSVRYWHYCERVKAIERSCLDFPFSSILFSISILNWSV